MAINRHRPEPPIINFLPRLRKDVDSEHAETIISQPALLNPVLNRGSSPMKPLLIALFTLGLLNPPSTFAATPDNHPLWKSDKLPDLYYEILVKSAEQEMKLQAPDGRFRSHLPATPEQDVRSLNMYIMEYI